MRSSLFKILLATSIFLIGRAGNSRAQITQLVLYSENYASSPCSTPETEYFYTYGNAAGTLQPNDSLTIYVNFNDGIDSTFKIHPSYLDSFGFSFTHIYNLPGTYQPVITATASSGVSNTAAVNPLVFTNTCGNISGTIYEDVNGNCTPDAGENLGYCTFVNAVSNTTGQTYFGFAGYQGHYYITVPVGDTYTVSEDEWYSIFSASCPASGSTSVTVSANGTYTANFGFTCPGLATADLSVSANATSFRPGYSRPLYIAAGSNTQCVPVNATITLTLDPMLSYNGTLYFWSDNTVTPVPVISGNTLTWTTDNLMSLNEFFTGAMLYCDPAAQIGDSACLTVTIAPAPGTTDPNPANNTYNFCVPYTNSLDPNEMSVSPRGTGPSGYIPVSTESIQYLVDFQNTGNDTAYNIMIADTLDPALDPASIHIIKSDFPVVAGISNGNLLQFRLNNINLPDSNTNAAASHGYVLFEARLKPAAQTAGTVIHNMANIYFDYNSAVGTNTTTNTLGSPTGIPQISSNLKATVYPDPADDIINVTVKDHAAIATVLIDMTGRTIQSQQSGNGSLKLHTKNIATGLYQLNIRSSNSMQSIKVQIQH